MMCRAEPADVNLRAITHFIVCLEEQQVGNVEALFDYYILYLAMSVHELRAAFPKIRFYRSEISL